MARITALTVHENNASRVNVEVDGHPAGALSADDVERLGLRVAAELDPAALAAVADAIGVASAYDHALRFLALRARSTAELRRKLIGAGESASHTDAAIARLIECDLLDDEEFARQFARSRLEGRGHAPGRIRQELARRGVPPTIADRAVRTIISESSLSDDFGRTAPASVGDALERLARKKLRSLTSLDRPTRVRRLYGFLARRGYGSDDVRRVIATVLDESAGE